MSFKRFKQMGKFSVLTLTKGCWLLYRTGKADITNGWRKKTPLYPCFKLVELERYREHGGPCPTQVM